MTSDELACYIDYNDKGATLTTEFYDLSLYRKYMVIEVLEASGQLEDAKLYDRLVLAVLQHSSNEMKRERPVKRERKQRPRSKVADQIEVYQALFLHMDRLMKIIFKDTDEPNV